MEPILMKIPGHTIITQKRKIFETNIIKYEKNEPIPKSSCVKWFDYDKIENAVVIRNRKEGDVIQINASGGRKKLKDYFIDQKIPQKQRDSQLLITDGNHVMWIPGDGERMSEKYKVDAATKNVLLMKMFDLEEEKYDT
jgi:tRNA(Ile)-lysidine synthase